jgi:hypothetical protein
MKKRPSTTNCLRAHSVLCNNAPKGIRIPVLALKGPRPSPLDDGGVLVHRAFYQRYCKWSNLFYPQPNPVAEIPRQGPAVQCAHCCRAKFVDADCLLAHTLLQQFRHASLAQCQPDQPLCVTWFGMMHDNLIDVPKTCARLHPREVLFLLPFDHTAIPTALFPKGLRAFDKLTGGTFGLPLYCRWPIRVVRGKDTAWSEVRSK